jgi:hypothetical protein
VDNFKANIEIQTSTPSGCFKAVWEKRADYSLQMLIEFFRRERGED